MTSTVKVILPNLRGSPSIHYPLSAKFTKGNNIKDIEEDDNEEDDNEEDDNEWEEEEERPATPIMMPKKSATMPKKSATSKSTRADEIELILPHRAHSYPSKNFWRERLVIVPPASFGGQDYEVGFDSNGMEFYIKFKPNPVLNDPMHIHNWQAKTYDREFPEDSLAAISFRKAAEPYGGKWHTFRHKCAMSSEFSEDLGLHNPVTGSYTVPKFEFVNFAVDGTDLPVIIVEIKSIQPIEKKKTDHTCRLTKKLFLSPSKPKNNHKEDNTSEITAYVEKMFAMGIRTPRSMQKHFREFADEEGDTKMSSNEERDGKKGRTEEF